GRLNGKEMNGPLVAFFVVSFLYLPVVSIATVVCAFKDSSIKGAVCLLSWFCALAFPYTIYWVYVESGNNALKAAFSVKLLLWVLIVVFAATHPHRLAR